MSHRALLVIPLSLMIFLQPAYAGVESITHNYVNLFNQAHKMNDQEQKDKYYQLIMGNEDILENVKKDYPTTYTLIRLEMTRRRLETIKFRLGDEALSSGGDIRITDTNAENAGLKSEKRAGTDNQSLVHDFPNQERAPNRSTSGSSNSSIRTTNRDTVQAFSNQDRVRRLSNQKRMRQQR
ncbi:MAG: hypothetical protein KC900_08200 [Candidatus Omnitrophica bacterium]|nr:hypothetical protein [Candidatus Omnitrophota bacterium]